MGTLGIDSTQSTLGHRRLRWFWPLALLGLGFLVRIPLLGLPLTYGSDIWRQADTASIARHFSTNANLFYPEIYWGGASPGYVETEFQLYPFVVAMGYRLAGGEYPIIGQVVSMVAVLAAAAVFYALAVRWLPTPAAEVALIAFLLAPISLRYSTAFMPEASVLFFYVLGLYAFDRWLAHPTRWMLALMVVATALALLIKPTSIQIGLIYVLWALARGQQRVFRRPDLWLAALAALAPAAAWYWHAHQLYVTYQNTFGLLSGGDSKFGSLRYWLDPAFYLDVALRETQWVAGGFGILLALGGAWAAVREKRWAPLIGLGVISLYYVIVARYSAPEWGIQYHIYNLVFVSALIGLGWQAGVEAWARHSPVWMRVLPAGLLLIGPVWAYQLLLTRPPSSQVDCGRTVGALTDLTSLLLVATTSSSIEDGVPNNYQEPVVFYYADRHGWSIAHDQVSVETIERYRQQGAGWLVIPTEAIQGAWEPVFPYLAEHADLVRVTPCWIFRFDR